MLLFYTHSHAYAHARIARNYMGDVHRQTNRCMCKHFPFLSALRALEQLLFSILAISYSLIHSMRSKSVQFMWILLGGCVLRDSFNVCVHVFLVYALKTTLLLINSVKKTLCSGLARTSCKLAFRISMWQIFSKCHWVLLIRILDCVFFWDYQQFSILWTSTSDWFNSFRYRFFPVS